MTSILAWFARVLHRPMVLESYGLLAYPKERRG